MNPCMDLGGPTFPVHTRASMTLDSAAGSDMSAFPPRRPDINLFQ